ncbi:calpain-13 [Ochotona princeps]|uniref:calpain-13 n=1 Tax=Ochotona princeps TaxID=9978 RepID=UPI002714A0AB|nr:calpain-13 [Ochotona princeps]
MAHNFKPVEESSLIKFNDQDFNSLRDHCLRKHQLFQDDTFPATASSIGQKLLQEKNLYRLEWKRPQELSADRPHFILEGVSRFDIQQGEAGDCWFLAALGSLTQNPPCLQKILLAQSFSHQYAGIFRFRFWQCGYWVEVVVDDRLPVVDNVCLFVKPRQGSQEFWPCLLEKAYAKLRGSYSHLHYGYLPDALVDLTGGVVTTVNMYSSPSDLMMAVKMAAKAGSLITCATPNGPTDKAQRMENGLVNQHAYTVTGAEQIQYRRTQEEIIRLWNPWGNTEWRGRWRDGSQEWQETHDPRKNQLCENKEDGEFWMSCQDFQENFSCLYVCNQFPIALDQGNMFHDRWSQIMFKNQVIQGNAAGESQRNMQYFFSVQEAMGGSNVVVSFAIRPQSLSAEDSQFPLQFQVFKRGIQRFQERLPPAFFSAFRNAAQGVDCKTKCNFTRFLQLSPGTYVVVLSTHHEQVEFLLRIFQKMPNSDRYSIHGMPNVYISPRVIFHRYVQQGPEMDATQLQSLLNQELLEGPTGDVFSLDECRSIVALMDLKVNGRLDQEEFGRLWVRLVHYQHVFQKLQQGSGVLLSLDLWKAIENTDFLVGVSISEELLYLMSLRYSDSSGHVSFPSLVCFLMRLETMAKTFHNLSKDGKGLYLTEMEWMNLVMYN